MLRNKLVRRDGSIIDSSVIISCEFSEEVNSDNNLTVGDVTSSELTVELLSTVRVEQDEMLTYYIIEDDVETLIGDFQVERPTIASRTSIKFSAYDNVIKTERLFADWLVLNQGRFPMTLLDLVQYACAYSGVTLATTDFPNAGLSVNYFYREDITCRQVLSWAAAIAGRFIRANAYGDIEFAWYTEVDGIICTPSATSYLSKFDITDDGEGNVSIESDAIESMDDGYGNVTMTIPGATALSVNGDVSIVVDNIITYFLNGVSYESYATDPVARVRINHSESDVGVVFPTDATGNCFTISGNLILGACSIADVYVVAASLYNTLSAVTYTPAKIRVPRTIRVRAGDIVRLHVPSGDILKTYAMRVSVSASGTTVESSGDKSHDTNAAVSNARYSNLTGRVMEVTQTAEQVSVKNTDLEGRVASMALTLQGLESTVLDTMKDVNALREDTTSQVTSSIQTAKELINTATETLVTKKGLEEYASTVTSQFSQSASELEIKFSAQNSRIDEVDGDLQAKYEERTKYIRFVDGSIVLGKDGNNVVLTIENDRISFKQNGDEVAYLAANDSFKKLYIVDGEFLGNLQVGKFALIPRTTGTLAGNLSFKKVST